MTARHIGRVLRTAGAVTGATALLILGPTAVGALAAPSAGSTAHPSTSPTASPSDSGDPVTTASPPAADPGGFSEPSPGATGGSTIKTVVPGTTFLTAVPMNQGDEAKASASTGEYLYWSYPAAAGQAVTTTVTLTLPPSANRVGDTSTWRVDVFDGLRRRQPCLTGNQEVVAQKSDATVTLTCTPPTVHPWAEPYSSVPLPGTYYVRISASDIQQSDIGQPFGIDVKITAKDGADAGVGGDDALAAPLVPIGTAGKTLQPGQTVPTRDVTWNNPKKDGWFSWADGPGGRWFWTAGAGVVTVITGVLGYSVTRVRRRWFGFLR